MFELDGKVALVTGASQGIGNAIARLLARQGAWVVAAARSTDKLESLVEELSSAGLQATCLTLDVSDAEAMPEALKSLPEEFQPVKILVNNAGITRRGPTETMPDEDWDAVVEVNLTAQFLCARAAARHKLAQANGRILTIASIVGLRGNAFFPHLAYQATKGALVNMTRGLAVEWGGRGIRVNAIAPTFFKTNFGVQMRNDPDFVARLEARTPLGRFGEPEELAGGILFLAGRASSMVTGHTLAIDGGWLAA